MTTEAPAKAPGKVVTPYWFQEKTLDLLDRGVRFIAAKLEPVKKLAGLIADRTMTTGAVGAPCPNCLPDYIAPMQAWAQEILAPLSEEE